MQPSLPSPGPSANSRPPLASRRTGFTAPSRDSLTTVRADGSRRVLHPADVNGRITHHRRGSALALIAIYISLPWIRVGGYPAVFLDVATRRFHLFGWTLAAQDLWLMFFFISGLGFSLFLLTALFGRVWCGWACPQTVFLEHVFRRFERWIDGDATRRRALDARAWDAEKTARRIAKHTVYAILSAGVAHLFLAYFVSVPELWHMMRTAPGEHWGAFVFVLVATAVIYFNFAWFREQLCIVICPYGRMQSALIDDHSVIIGYDATRGEPRAKLGTINAGACIDCNRCVQVCPTGIDIRQGLQIECIGCAACIDACDQVMTKIKRPTGLIRYDSTHGFAGRSTRWVRPRTIVYSVLLLLGGSVATWAVSTLTPGEATITRLRGAPYFVDQSDVRNEFLLRLINKRTEPMRFVAQIVHSGTTAEITGLDKPIEVAPLAEEVRPVVVLIPRAQYRGNAKLMLRVQDVAHSFTIEREIGFIGPDPELLREDEKR